jgi:hypothetical protein
MSLLEVLLALAIFLVSFAGLSYLVTVSGDQAMRSHRKTRAISLAQTKLGEVAAGAVPLQSQSDEPFEEDPDYVWSLDAESGGAAGLWNVTVRVRRTDKNGPSGEVSLSQMVIDPSIAGNTQDIPPSYVPGTSSSGGSGSSGSGTPSGASPGGAAPSTPKASSPAPSAPKASTPAPSAPKASTPAPSAPKASTPAPSAPKASTPAPSAPKASTPAPAKGGSSKGG